MAVLLGSILISFSIFAARSMPDEPSVSYLGKDIFFDNKRILNSIKDFYVNDSISRFSKTMAECSRAREEIRNPIREKVS